MAVSRTSGQGRPKGTPNKTTALVKDMVSKALDAAGGEKYLVKQSKENPVAFLTLVGKLIPVQVGGDPEGNAIVINIVRHAHD